MICVTETWLKEDEVKFVQLPNYVVANSFCRKGLTGGGTLMFTRQGLAFTVDSRFDQLSVKGIFEFCIITLPVSKTTVIIFYRPPKGDFNVFINSLDQILVQLMSEKRVVLLTGDSNIDLGKPSSMREQFLFILGNHGLSPSCNEPTRQMSDSSTIIDNVFTSGTGGNCLVADNYFSDHKTLLFSMSVNHMDKINNSIIYKRVFSSKSLLQFNLLLSSEDWSEVLGCLDPNMCFNAFLDTFLTHFESVFPSVRFKSNNKTNNKNKWWNPDLARMRNMLQKLDHLKYSSNETDKLNYKNLKKSYLKMISQAKVEENQKFINENKNLTKALWQTYKHETGKNKPAANLELNVGGTLTADPGLITSAFLQQFTPAPNSGTDNLHLSDFQGVSNSMFLAPTTADEVHKAISSLSSSKATGDDEIPNLLLKSSAPIISPILSHCFNLCFEHGVFPSRLKHSLVMPILKKPPKSELSNFRGIYLTSNLGKVLEKLTKNR